jgi:hypothetical protein
VGEEAAVEVVRSVNGVPIRLTDERWTHIVENHDELAGRMDDVLATIAEPVWVSQSYGGALIAWRSLGRERWLAVVYREKQGRDGFVITAFVTRKPMRKRKVWPSRS